MTPMMVFCEQSIRRDGTGGPGGYSQCGLTGGSSRFEGFTEWLPNDAICQPNTTNWRYS